MASVDVEALTDAAIAKLRRELEASLRRMAVAARRQLEGATLDEDGKISRKEGRNALLIARVGDQLAADFEEIIGQDAPQAWRTASAAVLQAVTADLLDQGVPDAFTRQAAETIRAMVDGTVVQIAAIAKEGAQTLQSLMRETTLSPVSPDDLIEELRRELNASLAETLTVADTAVMALDRKVVLQQTTEAGSQWFLYDGPVDKITRPFCRERVGKLFHISELDEVENDSGDANPPSIYCGGYNCRHRWSAVDDANIRQYPRWQNRSYTAPRLLAA